MDHDKELISRIAQGEESALRELHHLYYRRLSRFLLRVSRRPEIIVEVINDVFFTIWEKAHTFRGEAKVSTWIIGIAYRRALKALAKDKRQVESVDPRQPTTDLGSIERDHDLDVTLQLVTPDQRAVIELAYFFGYSYNEIGAILGCSENTVKTRMHRARRTIRANMESSS